MPQALTPPILRVNDDIFECIAEASLRDDDGRCDNGKTRALSQVCQRWRELILGRASFWNDLTVLSSASPDAVTSILERSQDAPLHISISGLHNSRAHELLQILPVGRFLNAASVQLFSIGESNMEQLVAYLEVAQQLPRVRKLEVEACLWNGTPNLFGPHLVTLLLAEVDCNLDEFAAVLQRAQNLENLRLIRVTFSHEATPASASSGNLSSTVAPCCGLNVLEIDDNDSANFHTTLDLIQQLYPRTLFNGASVELRCTWDERPLAELEFSQFTTADRLVWMDRVRFLVSYPAAAFRGAQPLTPWTPPRFASHFIGDQMMFRGFNCTLHHLEYLGPRRMAISHVLATVRCLVLNTSSVEEAITFLAHFKNNTFALMEEIQVLLQVSVHNIPRISALDNSKSVVCPRLQTLSISIDAVDYLYRDHKDFALVGHLWGTHCEAIIDRLEVPVGTMLTVHAQCSNGVSYAEEIITMLSMSHISDSKRTFTFKTA